MFVVFFQLPAILFLARDAPLGLPGLLTLDLSNLFRLTDQAMDALAAGECSHHLTSLTLCGCQQISQAAVSRLQAACPSLTHLDTDTDDMDYNGDFCSDDEGDDEYFNDNYDRGDDDSYDASDG